MTNTFAFGIAVVILGFFAIDYFVFELDAARFLLRKLIDFIQIVAFWR